MKTLYSILNRHTKKWWYFQQLRDQGKAAEARQLERKSIRDDVQMLRFTLATPGGHSSIGRGGCSLHAKDRQLQGYGTEIFLDAARIVGLPIIDSRTIPDKDIAETVSFPMIAVGRKPDPEPYCGFSYAPLEYVAGLYVALGAAVHNVDMDLEAPMRDLAKYRELRAMVKAARDADAAHKIKAEPVVEPTLDCGGVKIDLQDLANEGADGACLACGEYAYGVEPDATDYRCESCGAHRVWGAEQILLVHA